MSGFTSFFVRNWQFTLVIFLMLAVIGASSVNQIPRAEDPSFPIPIVIVRAILPGAAAADMEKLVADPLERAIDGLEDVKEIETVLQDGVAVIVTEFEWTTDPDKKFDEVSRELNALRPQLPANLLAPRLEKVRTSLTNIVQVAFLSETASIRTLEDTARDLSDIIERIPGIREAEVWGAPPTEVRISVDMGKLAERRIPITTLANVLRAEAVDTPPGAIHSGARRFNVKATGAFDTLEEIRDTVIATVDGRALRVRDVAEVDWAYAEMRHETRFNGKRAIFLTANMMDGQDVFTVRNRIFAALDTFEADLPQGVRMERAFDQSKNVAHRLNTLARDFAIALGLVLITLLPLGWRASIVVMISIPLSLAIGVTLLLYTGFTINQLSISGFVLALGLLVDDSIVVTENIARHLREGKTRLQAAFAGTSQIGVAVIGCTATLMLAFLPLLFLAEGAGKFTRSLPVTVLYTVGASLIVSLTIIPFLASRLLSRHEHPEGNVVLRGVMSVIHGVYRPILHVALLRPRLVVAISMALFALSLLLIPRLGFSLFPPAETPQFVVDVETPDGTALVETDRVVRRVEEILLAQEEVEWAMGNVGRSNPRIFYNVIPEDVRSNYGQVFVQLKEFDPRTTPATLDRMRAAFSTIAGAQINLRVFENGPPIAAPIAVRISGKDLATLKDLAAQATDIIESTPGVRNVTNPIRLDRTDLDLGVDARKAAILGVPAGAIDQTVRIALSGDTVGAYRQDDGDEFPIVLRLPMELRQEIDALQRIYVPTASGAGVPLSLITNPRFEGGPSRIDRYQRERTVTITAYSGSGYLTSKVTDDVFKRLNSEMTVPAGYNLSAGGQLEAQNDAFADLLTAIIIAIFGIIAVLILEFNSFRATGVVMGIIPLGIMGGLVALWLAGYSLSFTAVIGFVALIGIEIKNSILLVDFTNQLRAQGKPLLEAIEEAGEVRFLPILLTSVTAIGGLTPLALEASGLYSPLAWVIIGGLVSSTLLSRFVTPAMYLLLAPSDEAYARSQEAEEGP
ncbi:MAG: efflux RND transporter permease subunit [Alphaproteobacteria bacterium]